MSKAEWIEWRASFLTMLWTWGLAEWCEAMALRAESTEVRAEFLALQKLAKALGGVPEELVFDSVQRFVSTLKRGA